MKINNKKSENIRDPNKKIKHDFKDKDITLDKYSNNIIDNQNYVNKRANENDKFTDKRIDQKFKLNEPKSSIENGKIQKSSIAIATYLSKRSDNVGVEAAEKTIKGSVKIVNPGKKLTIKNNQVQKFKDSKLNSSENIKLDNIKSDSVRSDTKKNFDPNEKLTRSKEIKNGNETLKNNSSLNKNSKLNFNSANANAKKLSANKKVPNFSAKLNKEKIKNTIRKINDKAVDLEAKTSLNLANYLSVGSEDNVGVEAAEKQLRANNKAIQTAKQLKAANIKRNQLKEIKQHRRQLKREHKLTKKRVKKEYKLELMALKLNGDYNNKSAYKKFIQRRRMKQRLYDREGLGFKNKAKKIISNAIFSGKENIKRMAKKIGFMLLGIFGIFIVFFLFILIMFSIFGNTSTTVSTTTYLSDESVLGSVDQEYLSLEDDFYDELSEPNIKAKYPGFDEYIINPDQTKIQHDTHVLLAYLTARYGVLENESNLSNHLLELFNEIYSIQYIKKTEIRYQTRYYTIRDQNGKTYTGSYQEPYEWKKLIVKVKKKDMDSIVRKHLAGQENNLWHYEALRETHGNMDDYFRSEGESADVVKARSEVLEKAFDEAFKNAGIPFDDHKTKILLAEAKKHLNKPYKMGTSGPSQFDCSGFVCYVFNHSGVKNMPRTNAWGIYNNYVNPISPQEAKAGDIIFFSSTYPSGSPVSHVGIYMGNGEMIHAGNPIKVSSINTPYWKEHFYSFGRVK